MDCDKLTLDVLYDCADKPKKGIDAGFGVLINYDDIDMSASTVAGALITALVLKAGKSGVKVEWYKDLASANSAYTPSTEDEDGFTDQFLCRLPTTTAENAEAMKEIKNGRFVVVYETRYKGVDKADAFKVSGWENALRLSEGGFNTLENSGSILFTLATEEGDSEDYPYRIYLKTDYATSKADVDSLFAVV